MIIVIEGADGSGKDTVANEVVKRLSQKARVSKLNFPNDNAKTGPLIRGYLKRTWELRGIDGSPIDNHAQALTFQALQIANRLESLPLLQAVEHSVARHLIVVRYWQSAWVYGQLDGLDRHWIEDLHIGMPHPVVNILIDTPYHVCLQRRAQRDGTCHPERYEGRLEMTRKITALYRELWVEYDSKGWAHVAGEQPLETVVNSAMKVIRSVGVEV